MLSWNNDIQDQKLEIKIPRYEITLYQNQIYKRSLFISLIEKCIYTMIYMKILIPSNVSLQIFVFMFFFRDYMNI